MEILFNQIGDLGITFKCEILDGIKLTKTCLKTFVIDTHCRLTVNNERKCEVKSRKWKAGVKGGCKYPVRGCCL